jgi:YbbR domain-containing protein
MKELFRDWIYDNGSYKLVALFITLILWVSVLGRKETTVSKEIPLRFITSTESIVTNSSAKSVRFELTGSRRSLGRFLSDKHEPISVDLSGRSTGRLIVTVPEDSVRLPFGVKVLSINPASIVVDIDELTKKKVPIVVSWRESKENNRVIMHAVVEPSDVWIEGGKSVLTKIREILTLEVSSKDAVEIDGHHVIKTKIKTLELEGIKTNLDQDVTITF